MLARPVEVTEEQIARWQTEGFTLGLVYEYSGSVLPHLIAWKADGEKPNSLMQVLQFSRSWHLDTWGLYPEYHSRFAKKDVLAFDLTAYNTAVRYAQQIWDLTQTATSLQTTLHPQFPMALSKEG